MNCAIFISCSRSTSHCFFTARSRESSISVLDCNTIIPKK